MPPKYVLDTNLLILLLVGLFDRDGVADHPRTRGYSASDFDILTKVLGGAEEVVLTPNVSTEASNFLGHGRDTDSRKLALLMREAVEDMAELSVRSRDAVARPEFLWLGLTDAVLLTLAHDGYSLLTADGPLYKAALEAGCDAVHFEQLRQFAP